MAAPNAPSSPPVDLRQRYSVPEHWADPTMYFDPDRLPPLPPIPDAALARQAFRHRSSPLLQPGEPYDRNLNSYEPLEGIGDRLINYAAYKCLRQQFAGATATILGDVTRRLVTNSTFSYLSSAYGLLDRLEFGYSDNLTRNQKVAADLFEAYVGALDKGLVRPRPNRSPPRRRDPGVDQVKRYWNASDLR
ncbi:hypothetical protein C6P46_006125 [Rhodotorula mucilaginosa]|uniref:RNase III domain-containing protein n=1 Tax=Rhodotorula mucilaginosa TaxID=5537 RepID=A0A9P6VXI2_RHOMI|nr:hypothetical protein C6P46_006125 [Rhodotorula mucilaginosa]TKA55714.1 hypothetical protein B0A53_02850 [Rhodotorula sp. CCFEE 5036]